MYFGFMYVILLHSGHQHVPTTHGHLQGGENKNTSIIKMCPDHSPKLRYYISYTVAKFTTYYYYATIGNTGISMQSSGLQIHSKSPEIVAFC